MNYDAGIDVLAELESVSIECNETRALYDSLRAKRDELIRTARELGYMPSDLTGITGLTTAQLSRMHTGNRTS